MFLVVVVVWLVVVVGRLVPEAVVAEVGGIIVWVSFDELVSVTLLVGTPVAGERGAFPSWDISVVMLDKSDP